MLRFEIAGDIVTRSHATSPRDYSPRVDDIRSILLDVCEMLAADGGTEFYVAGFGDEQWPVDVETDLATFLEQLPQAINALKDSQESFTIDFFEQGLERRIFFKRDRADYVAHCDSGTDWTPSPLNERISAADLKLQLVIAQRRFVELAANCCPRLAEHPWLVEWATLTH